MKEILKKHGIIALVLGALWIVSYIWMEGVHGGLDSLGVAIIAAVFFLLMGGAFLLNLVLFAVHVLERYVPQKGKIILSYVLLAVYGIAFLYVLYRAFDFSYGRFFTYLKEGEFFSILYLLFLILLLIMFVIRYRRLKKYRSMR
ncbi:MAG: hypothetical protein IKE21_10090 [Erysipelotrichaceae bacterium]|nr:hypothetical protein [Erysipelotrichaceae bacterium]